MKNKFQKRILSKLINKLFRIKRFFNWPFISKDSSPETIVVDSKYFGPLRKRAFNSIIFNKLSSSSISALPFLSSPSAIFSTIISVWVKAFNRNIFLSNLFSVFAIRFVHFFFEILKKLPFWVKTYASTAVKWIRIQIRITTPSFEIEPCFIELGSTHSVSCNTPAIYCSPSNYIVNLFKALLTAVALELPIKIVTPPNCKTNCGKSSKSLTFNIINFTHSILTRKGHPLASGYPSLVAS